MPINGALLGAAFVAGVQPTDPLGIADWTALGAAWATWTIANVTASAIGPSPLIALGPVITGQGALIPGPAPALGVLLAAAALTADAPGLEKWLIAATHYTAVLASAGGINPTTLIAYANPLPPIGPVSGVGGISLAQDFDFAGALNVTDTAGIAKWKAVGSALKTHLTALGLVTPAMTNTAPAGPVIGTGVLS